MTDDTAAIRAAINAVNASTAAVGVVYFPRSAQPYLSSEITLTGTDKQIMTVSCFAR